jgi:hypothetical protein
VLKKKVFKTFAKGRLKRDSCDQDFTIGTEAGLRSQYNKDKKRCIAKKQGCGEVVVSGWKNCLEKTSWLGGFLQNPFN